MKSKSKNHRILVPGMSPTDEGEPEGSFILSIEGGEGSGKSKVACGAPGGIGYFGIDLGAKRAVKVARSEGKEIHLYNIDFDVPTFIPKQERDFWEERAKKIKKEIYEPYKSAWDSSIGADFRTLVQDTSTDIWDLHQTAFLGKLQQNPQMNYGPVKSEFMGMIKKAKRAGKIVILIHQTSDEYKDSVDNNGNKKSERTGKQVRKGMNKIGFLADGLVRTVRVDEVRKKLQGKWTVTTPASWAVEIITAKNNMEANGTVLEDPSFQDIMAYLDPATDPAYWE